jgi:cullin 4
MFTDIDLARNVLQSYKQSLQPQAQPTTPEMETDIMVLTTSYWPTYPILEMKIPPEITQQMVSHSTFDPVHSHETLLCRPHSHPFTTKSIKEGD